MSKIETLLYFLSFVYCNKMVLYKAVHLLVYFE